MNGVDNISVLKAIASYGHPVTFGNVMLAFPKIDTELGKIHLRERLKTLENLGYIRDMGDAQPITWKVTEQGRTYLASLQTEEQRLEEEKELTMRKLRADVVVSEWMKKTYWWTFVGAILGTATGVTALTLELVQRFR